MGHAILHPRLMERLLRGDALGNAWRIEGTWILSWELGTTDLDRLASRLACSRRSCVRSHGTSGSTTGTTRRPRRPSSRRYDRLTRPTSERPAVSTGVIVLIVIAVIVVIALIWAVTTYNGFVRLRNLVQEAWRQIDVELHRRHDLIPNLVESVKGYAAHERGVFDEVARARAAAASPAPARPSRPRRRTS